MKEGEEILIKWQDENPVQLRVKITGGDGSNNFEDVPAVWFQGQNYLFEWEIDAFIKVTIP